MRSSLPLQVLIYFNGWYDALLIVIMLLLYIWKAVELPYPEEISGMLPLEISLLFCLALIEYTRLFLGSRGNKTEQTSPLLWFELLSLPALALDVYFMLLQARATPLSLHAQSPRVPLRVPHVHSRPRIRPRIHHLASSSRLSLHPPRCMSRGSTSSSVLSPLDLSARRCS